MSAEPHYFIAIRLSSTLQKYFSAWQDDFKEKLSYKIWPHEQDLHITLKFLGPVADNKIVQLNEELQKIVGLQEFPIDLGSIGTFGKSDKPRVLWAGVDKTEALSALQESVDKYAVNLGFETEKRVFCPHITLAKKWIGDPAEDTITKIKKQYTTRQQMNVNEIVLFRIHPTKAIKYEVVQRYKLQGGE